MLQTGATMEAAFTWDDDRIALLTKMVSESYAARVIAERLGTTRNAVLGKCHRLGITAPIKPSSHHVKPKKLKHPKPKPIVTFGNAKATRVYSSVQTAQPQLRCVPVEPRNVTLYELNQSTECHYIPGDDLLYCGHPSLEGKSYCGPHYAVTREEPRPRKDRWFREVAA